MSRMIFAACAGFLLVILILPNSSIAQCDTCYYYDASTIPELYPPGPWEVLIENPGVTWDVSFDVLCIGAYDGGGAVTFYRSDGCIATADKYEIEVLMHVERSKSGYWTEYSFGASDGEKQVLVWGSRRLGWIGIYKYENMQTVPVDLSTPAKYRLVVDKSDIDPDEHKVELYRNGELLVTELYWGLDDPYPGDPDVNGYGFSGSGSDTEWHFLKFETLAPQDSDGDGYMRSACSGFDCDDENPNVNPGEMEVCDFLDNDCDGMTDENLFCNPGICDDVIFHYNDCSTVPEEYPGGAWVVSEPSPGVTWDSDGENLHLNGFDAEGSVAFGRFEDSLEAAVSYELEARIHIDRAMHGFPFKGKRIGFVVRDELKHVGVIGFWPGFIGFDEPLCIYANVDLYSPATYRLAVDRSEANPNNHTARLYRNSVLLIDLLDHGYTYYDLRDVTENPDTPIKAIGIGGWGSDTVWDKIEYSICVSSVSMINLLLEDVANLSLQDGLANSLISNLAGALDKIDDDNDTNDVAACNKMGAFINSVEAQRGKKIQESDADELIDSALTVISALDCN